jgi:predicted Zn-dependent peptidase
LLEYIDKTINEGIDEATFNRIKKMLTGNFIKNFNSVEDIAHLFVSNYFKNVNLFDYVNAYSSISQEKTFEILKTILAKDKSALSIINPIGE